MKTYFKTAIFSLAFISAGMIVSSSGCRKKKDTIAKIFVKDEFSAPVQGAQVVLKGQSTTTPSQPVVLFDTTSTNSAGEAIFNFNDVYQLGQAGVAVLDIEVEKGLLTGQGIIKIEAETTSEQIIFIQ